MRGLRFTAEAQRRREIRREDIGRMSGCASSLGSRAEGAETLRATGVRAAWFAGFDSPQRRGDTEENAEKTLGECQAARRPLGWRGEGAETMRATGARTAWLVAFDSPQRRGDTEENAEKTLGECQAARLLWVGAQREQRQCALPGRERRGLRDAAAGQFQVLLCVSSASLRLCGESKATKGLAC
jgi:hypothetical protein